MDAWPNTTKPLFAATQCFDPTDGEKWIKYIEWAKIPALTELVSLDGMLCPPVIKSFNDEDWDQLIADYWGPDYFFDLDYLKQRVRDFRRTNILGFYRNPQAHILDAPGPGNFVFLGYDLIEDQTQISALTNCGGFPDVFRNDELNCFGLIGSFDRACCVREQLAASYPDEPHAQCEMYALWRLII